MRRRLRLPGETWLEPLRWEKWAGSKDEWEAGAGEGLEVGREGRVLWRTGPGFLLGVPGWAATPELSGTPEKDRVWGEKIMCFHLKWPQFSIFPGLLVTPKSCPGPPNPQPPWSGPIHYVVALG